MLEIILIRHGETEHNRIGKFTGSTDVSINSKGEEQAVRLAVILKDDSISSVYTSDLKRCKETAKFIKCDKVSHTGNLREMDFGHWEGMSYNEIKEKYPEEIIKWESDWTTFRIPEGESFADMSRRVLEEFDKIVKSHNESSDKIAIVTHGGCIRTILGHYISGSIKECWKFQVENAAVTRLCFYKDYFYLKSLNEK
jgi:alpha-ribazole phosphatase